MKKTKILSLILTLFMLCTSILPVYAKNAQYEDISGHWAEEAIEKWSEKEIIQGFGGSFSPDAPLTRAQLAVILDKLLKLKDESDILFEDVSSDSWYKKSILRCNAAGILEGDGKLANPDSKVTREEAMTMLCRALGIKTSINPDLSSFKDGANVSAWAQPYVHALTSRSIVSGVGDGFLAPKADMSRAAIITVIDNSIIQYITEGGEYAAEKNEGIILISAENVKITGSTKAIITISPSIDESTVNVVGLTQMSSSVNDKTNIKMSGGSSSGSKKKTPKTNDLEISEEGEISGGEYDNVTIGESLEDGEVTLKDLVIAEDLIILGGGSDSVKLVNCQIGGKVIMAKEKGEPPRLSLTNTPINEVEIKKPAIIEAEDEISSIEEITASDNLEIKGENTDVGAVIVISEEEDKSEITLTVNGGSIGTVEAKAAVNLEGENSSVNKVIAEASVSVSSDIIKDLEIPESAEEKVVINISDDIAIEITVNSNNGAVIFGAKVIVVTDKKDENEEIDVTLNDEKLTHIHTFGEPEEIAPDCESDGKIIYACITCPVCTDENCEHTDCLTEAFAKFEIIPAIGHDFGDWEKSDNELHVRKCKNNDKHLEEEAHSFGTWENADENNHKKACSVCSCEITEEHIWDDGKITTEPTAEADGVKTYTCDICDTEKTEAVPRFYELDLTDRIESYGLSENDRNIYEICYYKEGTSGETEIVQLSRKTPVCINYNEAERSYKIGDYGHEEMKDLLRWSDKVFLRGKNQGEYDEFHIIIYDYDMLTADRVKDGIIYCDYYEIDTNEIECNIYLNNEKIYPCDLREGDVLALAFGDYEDWHDSDFVNIFVTRERVSGEISSKEESEDEEFFFKMSGSDKEYVSSEMFSDDLLHGFAKADVGDRGTFFLDNLGKIYTFIPEDEMKEMHDLSIYENSNSEGHELHCSKCDYFEEEAHYMIEEGRIEPSKEADGEVSSFCRCGLTKKEIIPYIERLDVKNWIDSVDLSRGEIEYYANRDYSNDSKVIYLRNLYYAYKVYVNDTLVGTLESFDSSNLWTDDLEELILTADNAMFERFYNTSYHSIYLTKYDYDMVSSVDIENQTINGVNGTISLNPENYTDEFSYKLIFDDKEIALSDLKEKDVLNMVWEKPNGDWENSSYVTIYVSRNILNGWLVGRFSSDNRYRYDIADENQKEHFLYAYDDQKVNLELDLKGDFYLTINGEIFCFFEGDYARKPFEVTSSLAVVQNTFKGGINMAGEEANRGYIVLQNGEIKMLYESLDCTYEGPSLEKGDIITLTANEVGDIKSIKMIYDYSENSLINTYDSENKINYVMGTASDRSLKSITIESDINPAENGITYNYSSNKGGTFALITIDRWEHRIYGITVLAEADVAKYESTILALNENNEVLDLVQIATDN